MGNWIKKDHDGRWRVDLHVLPRWLSLTVAAATVAIVVMLARRVDPDPAIPTWLAPALSVAAWIILGGLVLMLVRWLALRKRQRVPRPPAER